MYLGPPRKLEGLDDEDLKYLTIDEEEEAPNPLVTYHSPLLVDPVSGIYFGDTANEEEREEEEASLSLPPWGGVEGRRGRREWI